jgi:gliding motility-associated-like protein
MIMLSSPKYSWIFLFVNIFIGFSSYSQNWDWTVKGGGDLSDKASDVVMDAQGNTYVTGYYNEQGQFGSFNIPFSNPHSKEVFIAKIDPNGNYLWVRHGENYYDDRGLGMCLDENNNVYVTGTCWGGINFDGNFSSLPSSYTDNIYIVKYDLNGNFQWVKTCGTDVGDDHGHDIASDLNGNLYLTGYISSYCFGENGPSIAVFGTLNTPSPNDSLAFLAKLNPSGVFSWVKTFDGEDFQKDNRVAIDAYGNPYVVGGYHGTVNFGTQTLTSYGGRDIFVTKYDANGNHLFVRSAGSTLDDRADGIAIGPDDHVYITGEFKDKVGFGTDSINNNGGPNGRDIFVARMDLQGNWKWGKKAGSSSGSDRGTAVAVNNKYNIFISGQFRGSANFGSTINLDSGTDSVQAFVAAIDTTGKWRWALQGGGALEDRGTSVAVDTSCNLVTCGYYVGNSTFGPDNLAGNTKKDIYISKIADPCFGYDPPPPPPSVEEVCDVEENNIFTPNGDSKNDGFVFSSNCNATKASVNIINRWGNTVYSSSNLEQPWDGKDWSGLPVAEGVYFYIVEYTLTNGISKSKQGYIHVIR